MGESAVRTQTLSNQKNPVWDDVLELEVPYDFGSGTMTASMLDDDSNDDGINEDDPMGRVTIDVSADGGTFDQMIDGHGQLHGFRLKFEYEVHRPEIPDDL